MKRHLVAILSVCSGVLFFASCNRETSAIRYALEQQLEQYPQSHLQEVYKSFYQEYFGSEHLISDTSAVQRYLRYELSVLAEDSSSCPYFETVGSRGTCVRVSLRCVADGLLTEQQLCQAFIESAQPQGAIGGTWEQRWQQVIDVLEKTEHKPVDWEAEKKLLVECSRQNAAVHHSDDYRMAYNPHYRIVKSELFERDLKPFICRQRRR